MSSIDERIVSMKFNNQQFEKGVSQTTSSLDKLKSSLSLKGASQALDDVSAKARSFSLAGIADGVGLISSKFSALGTIGVTALSNIANKAINAGEQMLKSLTIEPIKAGFDEYELKMGSIQTILANTSKYGTKLPEVTANLDELNKYADKTIYNFGDMTKNIGLFTNSGMEIGKATSVIKGFSNAAAASGTDAEGASRAAYQLSQAMSTGTVRLMDWRSLSNVGMGNKNMQQGLIDIASAMGTFNDETTDAQTATGDFTGSLEKGWLSADVMSNYLKIMAGDMTDAEMASMGLTQAQVDLFRSQQKTAEEAATKVRTWSQLVGTMKEAVGSGWSETFDLIIGDFDQATELWSGVNDVFGGIIGDMSDQRNNLIKMFVDIGGRDSLIAGIKNAWQALNMIIMPIKSAFQEIFPPMTAGQLGKMANAFEDFMKKLQPSAETMKALKRIFLGVFAVLDIGWMIIKQVAGVFADLFTTVMDGSGGFLELAATLGDWLVKVHDAIESGKGLSAVFEFLGNVIKNRIEFFQKLAGYIADFAAVDSWEEAWAKVLATFEKVGDAVKKVWDWMQPFFKWIKDGFIVVKDAIGDFFKSLTFGDVMGGIAATGFTGVSVMIGLLIKKILGLFKKTEKAGPGFKDLIKGIFGSITDTFKQMQDTLKAAILMEIAIAIGILTLSIIALSFIDPVKLAASLGAISIMIGELVGAMVLLDKFATKMDTAKMFVVGLAMMGLALALLIMAAAAKIMSTMDWNELAKGMVGLGVGLGILIGGIKLMSAKDAVLLEYMAGSFIKISIALVILAAALKIMASMSWEEIGKAMTVLAGSMLILVGTMKLLKKNEASLGAFFVTAIAITVLAGALKVFASMSWEEVSKAMGVLLVSMLVLSRALDYMHGAKVMSGAFGILVVSLALTVLAGVMKIFATFSWEEIGKSMVMLAGSLGILVLAMLLMADPLVLAGAGALAIAAFGLMMLAPALVLLGTMSWDAIGRGLTVLAAGIGIIAVMGILLIPASVGFLLLGAAIFLLGTGVYLASVGLMLFAVAITALAAAAAIGSEQIKQAILTIIGMIPEIMIAIAEGIIEFAKVIAQGGVEFLAAFVTLFMSLIEAVNIVAPALVECVVNLIHLLVEAIIEMIPYLVDAGMRLLIGLMDGIAAKLPQLMDSAANLIIKFIEGLGRNAEKILTAGGDTVLKFINGITDYINNNSYKFERAGSDLFRAIVNGVSNAITNGGNLLRWAGERIGNAIIEGTKNALGINSPSKVFRDDLMPSVFEGVEDGNDKNLRRADAAGSEIGQTMINGMKKSIADIGRAVAADIDVDPTIRPVLDLSAIRKDAGLIGGMLPDRSLNIASNYAAAHGIATTQRSVQESSIDENAAANTRQTGVIFNQYNNSPKALSSAEIYRQTKNQLSVAKKELVTPNV